MLIVSREELAEENEKMLFADGFDDALIGTVQVFNNTVALYDRAKCIRVLQGQGMTWEDAEEYFDFNVTGAYVGENTPAFASIMRPERIRKGRRGTSLGSGKSK